MIIVLFIVIGLIAMFLVLKPKYKSNNLDKTSEEYKNTKKSFKKFNLMIMPLYIFEIIGICGIFSVTCVCGHPFINPLAVFVFMLFQFVSSLILYKSNEIKGKSFWVLLVYDVISILLFLTVIKLFPNDMDKLHSIPNIVNY